MTKPLFVLALALAPIAIAPLAAQGGAVNAPVAPEAIYIGLGGASPGVSVVDLNGFGQGTGDISDTRFPLNPNVGQPGVTPPLAPGSSNLDAGSRGAFTLTRDELGNTRLGSGLGSIVDMQLGQPLDLVYNNENINRNAVSSNQVNPATGVVQPGNTIMVAPHPNPPRLVFPPPNLARGIEAEEPTVTSSVGPPGTVTTTSPPCLPSPMNLLTPGNPYASNSAGIGLLGANFPGVFYGPQPAPSNPPPPTPFCPYTSRQQIGHFLYALDKDNDAVVALNSNRFTELARFPLTDPQSMAMSPNLKWLAVSEGSQGAVSIIDTDPLSSSFHQVIAQTRVGRGPSGLAWQPDNDDLLVCNTLDSSVSIIDPASFAVRRTIRRGIQGPIDVAVTARQTNFGFFTQTYFAYIVNGNGTVAIFESGPSTLGPDDTVALRAFPNAAAIQPDTSRPSAAAVWIAHTDPLGRGQVSRLELTGVPIAGRVNDRTKQWTVTTRIGGSNPTMVTGDPLSGDVVVDLAFDDIVNHGARPDFPSPFHQIPQARHSSKSHVKNLNGTPLVAASPMLMFVALGDSGVVDVIEPNSGRRLISLPAPGVESLCHYWRQ